MNKLALMLMILPISVTLVACQSSTVIEPTNATPTVALDTPDPMPEPDVSSIFLQKRNFDYQITGYTLEITPEIDKAELRKYESAKKDYDDAINDYHKKWELCKDGKISEEELFREYETFIKGPCKNFWEIVDEIN